MPAEQSQPTTQSFVRIVPNFHTGTRPRGFMYCVVLPVFTLVPAFETTFPEYRPDVPEAVAIRVGGGF